jgi:hypothetical protein
MRVTIGWRTGRFVVAVAVGVLIGSLPGLALAPPAAAATPTTTVSPSAGLVDGQTVKVDARGFVPNSLLTVRECSSSVLEDILRVIDDCDLGRGVTADATGSVSLHFVVREEIPVGPCHVPLTCIVFVVGSDAAGPIGAGAPIAFAGPPPPVISATPHRRLHDGQVVQVTGHGFTAVPVVNDWFLSMCKATILRGPLTLTRAVSECDVTTPPFVFTHADAKGDIHAQYAVRRTFSTGTGTHTCGPGRHHRCALLVAQFTNRDFVGDAARLVFAPPVPTRDADCRHGGWRKHANAHGRRFVSKQACLRYVERHATK